MKGGVARLIKEDEVREAVIRHVESQGVGRGGNDDDNGDEDNIVSTATFYFNLVYFILHVTHLTTRGS